MTFTTFAATQIDSSGPNALVPSGTVLDYAGPTAPSGWTECDGSAVSRTTFATLFTAIGTTWGIGDGSTTFNVPDLRRRATVGRGGAGTGTLGNALGNTGGEENHVLSVGELATHNHTVTDPGHTHTVTDPTHNHTQNAHAHGGTYVFDSASTSGYFVAGAGPVSGFGVAGSIQTRAAMPGATATNNASATGITNVSNTTGITTVNNGSNTGHNTIQPSAVMIKIIKN